MGMKWTKEEKVAQMKVEGMRELNREVVYVKVEVEEEVEVKSQAE